MKLQNPCLWSNVTITAGAVIVFVVAFGIVTRSAYLNGFAAGFTAARERFRKVIDAAHAADIFKRFEDDHTDGTP